MYPNLFYMPEWVPLLGGAPITTFGVMMFLAFLTGGFLMRPLMRREGIDPEKAWDVIFMAVIGGIVGAKVYYAPDYVQSGTGAVYGEGETSIDLPWNFNLSAALGYQNFEESYGPSYWTWNAGVSWTWKDAVTFDVRYWDTDLSRSQCAIANTNRGSCDARVVASVSFDTSGSALRELTGVGSMGR